MTGGDPVRMLDRLPEAVVIVDPDGVVTDLNDRAHSLLGLDGSAIGAPLDSALDLRDDTDASATECLMPSATGVVDRLAEQVLHAHLPDGRVRAVSVTGRLDDHGAVLTFRHAGRRERLDSLRSDLVATVSHEIRSPLASVKGFTRTMLKKWSRFSDEQKRQMLATIDADADRVTRLLTELLDVSRIDAGRVRLDRRMIALETIVSGVAERLSVQEDAPKITVTMDDGVPTVYADPDKMEQVVTNLVENALRHARSSPVELGVSAEDGEVRIVVRDQGPGIPPDMHRRIFEKFARGRGDRGAGTGLGLYITKGLVEAHGGRVTVTSEPDDGATFVVALPAGEPDFGAI